MVEVADIKELLREARYITAADHILAVHRPGPELRSAIMIALEMAHDVALESAPVAPAAEEPAPALDAVNDLDKARDGIENVFGPSRLVLKHLLAWAERVEARHQREEAEDAADVQIARQRLSEDLRPGTLGGGWMGGPGLAANPPTPPEPPDGYLSPEDAGIAIQEGAIALEKAKRAERHAASAGRCEPPAGTAEGTLHALAGEGDDGGAHYIYRHWHHGAWYEGEHFISSPESLWSMGWRWDHEHPLPTEAEIKARLERDVRVANEAAAEALRRDDGLMIYLDNHALDRAVDILNRAHPVKLSTDRLRHEVGKAVAEAADMMFVMRGPAEDSPGHRVRYALREKRRPTVHELEEILARPDGADKVVTSPDGSISAVPVDLARQLPPEAGPSENGVIKLYEARLDPAYGVVRLEMDVEGLWLWIAGQAVYRRAVNHSAPEMLARYRETFKAEAKRRGGSDQERVAKAEALLDIGYMYRSDAEVLASMGTDAAKWAAEFSKHKDMMGNEGWLIGWFANAIEAGREAGRPRRLANFMPEGHTARCEPNEAYRGDLTYHRLVRKPGLNDTRWIIATWLEEGYWLGPASADPGVLNEPRTPEHMDWIGWAWHSQVPEPDISAPVAEPAPRTEPPPEPEPTYEYLWIGANETLKLAHPWEYVEARSLAPALLPWSDEAFPGPVECLGMRLIRRPRPAPGESGNPFQRPEFVPRPPLHLDEDGNPV